jgi:hypothetical protein
MGTKKTLAVVAMLVGIVALCTATCCVPTSPPGAPSALGADASATVTLDGGVAPLPSPAALTFDDAGVPACVPPDAGRVSPPACPSSSTAKDFCALAKKVCCP